MKRFLLLLSLSAPVITFAQHEAHEVHEMPEMHIEGHLESHSGPEKGSGTADKGGGDKGGGKDAKSSGPSTTVSVGAGTVTVSQKAVNQAIAILQEYYGTDFFSSLFSPSMLPGNGMQTQLADRLKDLAGEAARENRKADADFFNDLGNRILNKSNIQYRFNAPQAQVSNQPSISIDAPLVYHNIVVQTAAGNHPGMLITVPGYIANAQGQRAELLIRFYMPDGAPLRANYNEAFYRDVSGLVVTGTGALPVLNQVSNLSQKSLLIPYYALNLRPTNGVMQYKIKARASLYLNNQEFAISEFTPMIINY